MRRVPPVLIILFCATVLLLAGLLVFNRIPRQTPDEDDWYVLVKGSVLRGERFSIEDLRSVAEEEIVMALLGTNEDGRSHEYRGISLGALLDRCEASAGATSVTIRASDTYSTSFPMDDAHAKGIYLVWEKDGKALKGRSEGGPGPVRLLVSQAIAGEYNAQRSVKYVSEVVVQ